MSRIRFITFDAYNTLFKPKGSVSGQYAQEAAKVGIHVNSESISRHFGEAYRRQVAKAPFYGQRNGMTTEQWWGELVYTTFKGAGVPQKELDDKFNGLFDALYTRFTTRQGYTVFPDVIDTLKDLRRQGFKMGVISNSDERIVKAMESLELTKYFDVILTSCDAGHEKPDAKIFDFARGRAGSDFSPAACLHVGDDPVKDYLGATRAGWNAVLLQRGKLSYEDYTPALTLDGTNRHPQSILTLKDLDTLISNLYGKIEKNPSDSK